MLNRTQFLGAIVLFALLLSSSSFVTQAAPSRVETPIPRLHRDATHFTPPELPDADFVEQSKPLSTDSSLNDYTPYPYSRIAYQSARNDNWEIYYGDIGYLTPYQVRLTWTSAADILPRLSHDNTRIVFTSNRDGNFELYSMKTDGSDLQRLTWNSTDDVYPAWSPDGKKIAFQAYRDGQAEIYLINRDGSNPQRLTINADYDGEPYWSPDGQKIAFSSYRNGGYRIWTMKPDGSNLTQISSQPYSGDPTWSPDGKKIAFDADADYDGWLDLWSMNSDGSGQRLEWKKEGSLSSDMIPRGWSAESTSISYTKIDYTLYNSEWYWYSASMCYYRAGSGSFPTLIIGDDASGKENWHPDWQPTDLTVPVSFLHTLPDYSDANNVVLNYEIYDPGEAPIQERFLEVRKNDSQEWNRIAAPYTQAIYKGTPGDLVTFRLRAVDEAWNSEPWQPNAYTHTRLYHWMVAGQVRDNRGYPVPAASGANSTPAINEGEPSDAYGILRNFYTVDASTLKISKNGFGNLPDLGLASNKPQSNWWGLPPADNRLANGNFETADLSDWTPLPEHSSQLSSDYPLSGSFQAGLGMSLTMDPETLRSPDGAYLENPDLVRDGTGRLHAVWIDWATIPSDQTPDLGDVFYSSRPASGDWSEPSIINPIHTMNSRYPVVTTSPDGTLHVAWMDMTSANGEAFIQYASKPAAGSWSTPATIAVVDAHYSYNLPNEALFMAAGPDGIVHLVWTEPGESWYIYKNPGGSWSSPEAVPGSDMSQALVVTSDSVLHRIFYTYDNSYLLSHAQRPPGGSWSVPEVIASNSFYVNYVDLAANTDGTLNAVWRSSIISFSRKPPGGSWEKPITLENVEVDGELLISANASEVLVLISAGWTRNAFLRHSDGSWAAPQELALDCYHQALDPEMTNQAETICWHTLDGISLIYTPLFLVTQPERRLAQTVSLPANLHEPTLAFGYRTEGDPASGQFDLLIDGTSVFSTTQITSAWTQFSLDLSPWAGQTIELAFQAARPDPNLLYNLFLDDISVGSWLTPVIERAEPRIVAPNQAVTIILHGQNFIATPQVWVGEFPAANVAWLDGQTLSFDLPGGLTQGLYPVRVVNPGGQAAVQVHGFQIGGWQALPIIKRR